MNKLELKKQIYKALIPYINKDYYLLDIPNHYNIGDSLILLGEQTFLKGCNHKCLGMSSLLSFDDNCLEDDSLVLFQGGGYFGDLWRKKTLIQDLMEKHPSCSYLIFPQSVYYENQERLRYDSEIFSKCSNVTICARDKMSYNILTSNFKTCNILLVPDMAFCINVCELQLSPVVKENLYLCRYDRERNPSQDCCKLPANRDECDWPTINSNNVHLIPLKISMKIRKVLGINLKILYRFENYYWKKFIYPYNVSRGSLLVSKYSNIYTTRLHGAIIALLLSKKVYLFRNSYHKNESFYNTWLSDNDNVVLL